MTGLVLWGCADAREKKQHLCREAPEKKAAPKPKVSKSYKTFGATELPAFSFVVLGDTQFHENRCHAGPPELNAFPQAVLSLSPDFVVGVGDLMHEGRHLDAYHVFTNCLSELLDRLPFLPAIGNHDMDYEHGLTNYRAYLEQQLFMRNPAIYGEDYAADFSIGYADSHDGPGPSGKNHNTQYSFKYGNAYFLVMEQGSRWETNTPVAWVERKLRLASGDASVAHIFVVTHHPLYSTYMPEGPAGDALLPVRVPYERLFRRYNVTAVFTGHAHIYERFFVPDDDKPTRHLGRQKLFTHDGTGIHHITVGPSGSAFMPGNCARLWPQRPERSLAFFQARGCGHNMVQVVVRGRWLDIRAVGLKGKPRRFTTSTWDRFTVLSTI